MNYRLDLSLRLSFAGKTDKGLVRAGNEDFYKIVEDNDLFVVCDGMGGHQAGEVASRDACETIAYCFTELSEQILTNPTLTIEHTLPRQGDLLVRAIRIANRSIYLRSRSNSELTGMGTTIVTATFENDLIQIAHVGDSRAYLMAGNALTRMTTDHSWVSEMQNAGQLTEEQATELVARNVITRALGVNDRVEIDYRAHPVKAGEIYILCSDGLCGYADDEEIYAAAAGCRGDVEAIVDNLVELANDHGGQDNVTVVAVKIEDVETAADHKPVEPLTIPKESDEALLAENDIVNSILSLRQQEEEAQPKKKAKTGRLTLTLIFLLFVIIAAIFIYFTSGR